MERLPQQTLFGVRLSLFAPFFEVRSQHSMKGKHAKVNQPKKMHVKALLRPLAPSMVNGVCGQIVHVLMEPPPHQWREKITQTEDPYKCKMTRMKTMLPFRKGRLRFVMPPVARRIHMWKLLLMRMV